MNIFHILIKFNNYLFTIKKLYFNKELGIRIYYFNVGIFRSHFFKKFTINDARFSS